MVGITFEVLMNTQPKNHPKVVFGIQWSLDRGCFLASRSYWESLNAEQAYAYGITTVLVLHEVLLAMKVEDCRE